MQSEFPANVGLRIGCRALRFGVAFAFFFIAFLLAAALAGRADLMERFASQGVMHGGTYNAHPVTMAATVAVLGELRQGDVYAKIERNGRALMDGIAAILKDGGVTAQVQGVPGVFQVAFGLTTSPRHYRDTTGIDKAGYVRFTEKLLGHGVRALERGAWFLSSTHDETVIADTLAAVRTTVRYHE